MMLRYSKLVSDHLFNLYHSRTTQNSKSHFEQILRTLKRNCLYLLRVICNCYLTSDLPCGKVMPDELEFLATTMKSVG